MPTFLQQASVASFKQAIAVRLRCLKNPTCIALMDRDALMDGTRSKKLLIV